MSKSLDEQLRAALRRVDPEKGFAERVIARIQGEQIRSRRAWRARSWWLPPALTASAIFGAIVMHAWQLHHEQQGLEARQQLIDALRVTGEKLDLAYRVVNAESQPSPSDDTGA